VKLIEDQGDLAHIVQQSYFFVQMSKAWHTNSSHFPQHAC